MTEQMNKAKATNPEVFDDNFVIIFLISLGKHFVVGTHKKHLAMVLLVSTHNIIMLLWRNAKKDIQELS